MSRPRACIRGLFLGPMRAVFPVIVVTAALMGSCGEPEPASPHVVSLERGKGLYTQVCAQCHGLDARGVPMLGADLTTSTFFLESTDDELVAMISKGKPAADGRPPMPPKGGRLDLTEHDLLDIIAYIKTLSHEP